MQTHPRGFINNIITRLITNRFILFYFYKISQLAQIVVNSGGIGALIEVTQTTKSARLPAIMALGFIAGHFDQFAMTIAGSKGVTRLSTVLDDDNDDHVVSMTIWALGQIGKHSHEHAKAIAIENVFPKILHVGLFFIQLIFILRIYLFILSISCFLKTYKDVSKIRKLRGS